MIDRHKLWEQILFDEGLELRIFITFVSAAEMQNTTSYTPTATEVVREQIDAARQGLVQKMTPDTSLDGYGRITDRAIRDAIGDGPTESLVQEVAEAAKDHVPREHHDLVEWDI